MKNLRIVLLISFSLLIVACSNNDPGSENTSGENGNNDNNGNNASNESDAEETVIRYTFWGSAQDRDLHVKLTEEFNDLDKGIEVNPIHVSGSDEYIQTIQTRIAGGNPPDVINFVHNDLLQFAARDVLVDLTEWYERDFDEENFGDNIDYLIEGMQYEGRQYALPRNAGGWYLYYNKSIFDEANVDYPDDSWTWETFVEEGKKLTNDASTLSERTWAFGLNPKSPHHHLNFIWQAGGDYFNEDQSEFTIGSPESLAGIQFVYDLMYEHKISPDPSVIANHEPKDLFMSGQLAMYADSMGNIPTFQPIEGFEWDFALLPEGPGGNRYGRVGATALAIPQHSDHPEAAWEFIKFVNGTRGQEILASAGFSAPVRESLLHDEDSFLPEEKFGLNREVALEGASTHGKLMPTHSNWTEINDIVTRYLDLYFVNSMTLDEAIESIMNEVTPLLE